MPVLAEVSKIPFWGQEANQLVSQDDGQVGQHNDVQEGVGGLQHGSCELPPGALGDIALGGLTHGRLVRQLVHVLHAKNCMVPWKGMSGILIGYQIDTETISLGDPFTPYGNVSITLGH